MKLYGTYQQLVYADDVNVLGHNIDTTKKETETHVVDASKGVGLEVNAGKAKYMLLSRHQKTGKNHHIKAVNSSFENVTQFKYL
jgi:hypothetical protein